MTFTVIKDIKFNCCKSTFLSQLANPASLPQSQLLNNFIMDNNIHDVQYIAAPEIANTTSDMIALVVNDRYRSLDELCQLIIHTSRHTNQYFYLAVNKFYIYSAKNLLPTSQNYDNTLIEHCYNLVKDKFTLLSANSQPNDRGTLGNFVHPVTTLYLLRHG